jgi:hypothetical protein
MAILAETSEELVEGLGSLVGKCFEYGMKINVSKTKVMVVGEQEIGEVIEIDGRQVDEVREFKYLGSWIAADGKCEKEIKCRIGMAKAAWETKKRLLSGPLDLGLKKRLLKCYVWSVFAYGAETWTLRKRDMERIEAFEMWCWRRLMKISWVEKVTNKEVLQRVQENRSLLGDIIKRKRNWLGHVLRHDCLLKDMLEGSVEGKNKRGRKRTKMVDSIKAGGSYEEMRRKAWDREGWRNLVFSMEKRKGG